MSAGPLAPRPGPILHAPGSAAYGRSVAEAIGTIRETMARACAAAGRDMSDVALLAVTKFNPPEAVLAALAAGLTLFGENRVQEAEGKFGPLKETRPDIELHLLGHLQTNKARKAVELFNCVQSVDSGKLLAELSKRAQAAGIELDVLLELHTGEESKSGFPDLDELSRAFDEALALPGLRPRGLMTMAPYTDDVKAIRASFRTCRKAFDTLARSHDLPGWDTVSMGMTNDYPVAIEEGSTLVRIGTAIFGERAYP